MLHSVQWSLCGVLELCGGACGNTCNIASVFVTTDAPLFVCLYIQLFVYDAFSARDASSDHMM